MNTKNAALIAAIGTSLGLLAYLAEIFGMITFASLDSHKMFDATRSIISSGSIIYFFIVLYQQHSGAPSASTSTTSDAIEKSQTSLTSSTSDKNLGIGLVAVGGAGLFWVFIRMTSLAGKLCSWSPPFSSYETETIVGGLIALLCLAIGARKLMTKAKDEDKK